MLDERITKRIPEDIWGIAVKLVKEDKTIRKNFEEWLKDHLKEKVEGIKEPERGFELTYIKSASNDVEVINGYVSEYIWDNYGSMLDFISKNEETVLEHVAALN